MAMHLCKARWDPQGEAAFLANRMQQLLLANQRGWGCKLQDPVAYTALVTLKTELEQALGLFPAIEGPFMMGTVSDPSLVPAANNISTGLRGHANDPDHSDPMNPPGQFGWIKKVDPDMPFTELDNLLLAVRDCLDTPPGGGRGTTAGAAKAEAPPAARKPASRGSASSRSRGTRTRRRGG